MWFRVRLTVKSDWTEGSADIVHHCNPFTRLNHLRARSFLQSCKFVLISHYPLFHIIARWSWWQPKSCKFLMFCLGLFFRLPRWARSNTNHVVLNIFRRIWLMAMIQLRLNRTRDKQRQTCQSSQCRHHSRRPQILSLTRHRIWIKAALEPTHQVNDTKNLSHVNHHLDNQLWIRGHRRWFHPTK